MHIAQCVVSMTSRTETVAAMRVSCKSNLPHLDSTVQCLRVRVVTFVFCRSYLPPRPPRSIQSEPPTASPHMTTLVNDEYN